MSRAYTEEEVREMFLDSVRGAVQFWANVPDKTPQERCDGVAFSILNIFDGTSGGMPAFDLLVAPHSQDKQFAINKGSDYFEPQMMINDCYLHELYYKRG